MGAVWGLQLCNFVKTISWPESETWPASGQNYKFDLAASKQNYKIDLLPKWPFKKYTSSSRLMFKQLKKLPNRRCPSLNNIFLCWLWHVTRQIDLQLIDEQFRFWLVYAKCPILHLHGVSSLIEKLPKFNVAKFNGDRFKILDSKDSS